MSSDQVATLALALESNQFNAGLRHSQTLMRGLGQESTALTSVLRQTGLVLTSLVAGNKAVQMMTGAIRAASAAREDLAQFNHVMRNTTKTANDMVKSLTSDAYGRTGAQARQMLMGLTSLAKGMGITDKAAVQLSGEFSKMAVDIGSFTMNQPEAVMGAFQSALMGNTMALRNYGVFLNETTLKETISANAKKGLVFANERQARAYAVLTEAQKQQADAMGDYAVESQNFGNQLKKFYGGLSEIPAKFGKGLLEPANEFLKVANGMIDRLNGMDDATWKTISTMTALGTVLGIGAAGYTTLKAAAGACTIAKGLAAAATATSTAAITAETAALTANTAARTANAAVGATMTPRHTAAMLPFARQEAALNRSMENFRITHSRVNSEIATAEAAQRVAARRYIRATNPAEQARYERLLESANSRVATGRRRRDNLERNMESLNVARNRNNTARRVARQSNSQSMARNMVRRSRYNRAARSFSRSPLGLVGRGVGGAANALGITAALKFVGSSVMRWIPTATKQWGGVALRSVATALLPIGGTVLAALNPISWGVAIVGGLAAVGNYLPTLMYKAYDGFVSMFSSENMGKVWEWFKDSAIIAFDGMVAYLGKGLYGCGLVLESLMYTGINALGNGLRQLILNTTWGTVDIGEFNYKSSGYIAYEAQKKTNEMQARIDEEREKQNKIAKRITDMRGNIVEQERKLQEQEESILKKRSELAAGRFDTLAKQDSLVFKAPILEMLTHSIEAAIPAVQGQVAKLQQQLNNADTKEGKQRQIDFEQAQEEADKAKENTESKKKQYDNGGMFTARFKAQYEQAEKEQKAAEERLQQTKQALDAHGGSLDEIQAKWDAVNAQMTSLMTDKEKYAIQVVEQYYALFDAKFENANKTSGGYHALLAELQDSPILKQQAEIEANINQFYHELDKKQRELNRALRFNDTARVSALQEEIKNVENNIEITTSAYNELQANLSDQRKVREKMESLHKDASDRLWTFKYDHVGRDAQQQMARSGFFKAQNQFEGAGSDDEREKALQDMQAMYSKLDKIEMPVWNGMIRTTAGAVESDSVAAQELQERVLNDFNKICADHAQQQTVIQKAMRAALELMVKNTDPNQQPCVGGTFT